MNKVLTAFAASRSLANATKVVAYSRKHPMAECMLSPADLALFNEAKAFVAGNGAKLRSDMQDALRKRFPGMNIEVI